MTFISEYFIFDSLSNHLIEFFGNDESCFNLFPSLSSATAPINFPSIKRQADESE